MAYCDNCARLERLQVEHSCTDNPEVKALVAELEQWKAEALAFRRTVLDDLDKEGK